MYLSIAFAALALDLTLKARRGESAPREIAAGATAGMLLTLGILTAALVRFYPWPERLNYNLNLFAGHLFPAAGMDRQAAAVSEYMNWNPQFSTADKEIGQAVQLVRMGRHAEARRVLELALAEKERVGRRNPDHATPRRIAGKLLQLLGRQKEAERSFQDALAMSIHCCLLRWRL